MGEAHNQTISHRSRSDHSAGPANLFDEITSPLLRLGARRLTAALDRDVRKLDHLQALARCVDENSEAALGSLVDYSPAAGLELLRRLRAEVLRGGRDEERSSVNDLLTLTQSFDRTQVWLEARTSPPVDDAAAPRMNLAVEIAHDLRSPLTSILFLSQTLRRGESGEINELQRRQLGLIYAAALGVVSLASNLIEMAQDDDRLFEQYPSPFSVREMLDSIFDMVRPLAEEKKLMLRSLPPAVDSRVGFSGALSRVLLNLVSNALQHTDEGYVEISVRPKGQRVLEFSVRDTGIGLTEEAVQGLFDPFKRARKGAGYGFSGSGLGLAICRRLLAAMESELMYETAPGWGTRFFFDVELPPAV